MIDILPQIAHNYIAQAAFWGWFTAQAMYDASGVRLEAGRQAQILNQIVDYFTKKNIPVVITRKEALKELLGHTPIEVFGGLILGVLVAFIQFYCIYHGVI